MQCGQASKTTGPALRGEFVGRLRDGASVRLPSEHRSQHCDRRRHTDGEPAIDTNGLWSARLRALHPSFGSWPVRPWRTKERHLGNRHQCEHGVCGAVCRWLDLDWPPCRSSKERPTTRRSVSNPTAAVRSTQFDPRRHPRPNQLRTRPADFRRGLAGFFVRAQPTGAIRSPSARMLPMSDAPDLCLPVGVALGAFMI